MDTAALSMILERFYSVPTGQNTWWDALSAYADLFPNVPMALVGYEGRLEEANAIAYANYDGAFIRSYEVGGLAHESTEGSRSSMGSRLCSGGGSAANRILC